MIMKKILATLLIALGLVAIGPAALATPPAAAATVTITFDADGSTLPVAAAAQQWGKNTGVTTAIGDCIGIRCIHFKAVQTIPCNWSTFIGGCAYPLGDGSCQVEVYTGLSGEYADDLITNHEAGHCVFWYGGASISMHLDNPRALMYATHSTSPSLKETQVTSVDRNFAKSLFG